MTSTVRRAAAFALVGSLSLLVPALSVVRSLPAVAPVWSAATETVVATAPFVLIAVLALTAVDEGRLFDLFERPGDRQEGKLYGLAGFALAVAGLALLSVQFGLPVWAFVGSVFALSWGNVGERLVDAVTDERVVATGGFVAAGFLAATLASALAATLVGVELTGEFVALLAFLGTSAGLLGALLRSVLFERDDPLVLLSIGLVLWLFSDLPIDTTATRVAVALGVTAGLGYVSYALDTASLPGMLTGVFLGLLTIVLGDFRWFAMLITFFGLGGLSTKFRYDEKLERGIAEENEGARGSGNVLANSLVALVAVLVAAASPSHTGVEPVFLLFAFAGSVSAAMSDTFSSEFGGLYDEPRLITTLERVEPGTDGGVTWQGGVAGVVGAALIAGIAAGLFGRVGPTGGAVILAAGVAGMLVDSLLGATIEGQWVGNQGVNFLATLAAAVVAAALAVAAVPL
ncbi:DUF92 domain-containing protein [Halomicrobium salinisoli]|uniref:DUF92 domain-containing protein n=1 Tax=Halomicrobium salinisoli TaxID=2878391 RepID=UPI001CF0404F|nr:DUF92 domain-containing protein [Halomicrobium salinisoli]